jgi:hypothetical protein
MLRGAMTPPRFLSSCLARKIVARFKRLLAQLDEKTKNYTQAVAIRGGCRIAMANAARRYPLYVNDFFMKKAKSCMGTVVKKALGIKHYWGRVEFARGRGAIHLHIIGIARDKAYLWNFYHASTNEEKADVLDKYVREIFDMTADININNDQLCRPDYLNSPLEKRYCDCQNQEEE